MPRNLWTREELIVVYNLYCKIPFSKLDRRNPAVIDLAQYIDRSVSAIALKLVNFARLDPDLHKRNISGMKHGSKAEEEIWAEFHGDWERLAFESESLLVKRKGKQLEEISEFKIVEGKSGEERNVTIKQRVNQHFFREMVLASYDNTCCISGLRIPELLNAGHIIPWSIDQGNRVNPRNGICFNAFYDRAFDRGFMTVSPDFTILFSSELTKQKNQDFVDRFIAPYQGKLMKLPQRFLPQESFLEYHNNHIFKEPIT